MFNEILKKIRIEKGITQTELAKHLDLKPNTISGYEKGINHPDFNTLIKIAKYFECTTDYLLGITMDKKEEIEVGEDQIMLGFDSNHELTEAEIKAAIEFAKEMKRKLGQ